MMRDWERPAAGAKKREAIRETIRAHLAGERPAPGTKLPTAHAMALRFGVSYVTAHSALDDLVREGLLVRHQGKGTFVGPSYHGLRRQRPSRLVIVLPPRRRIGDSGNSEVVLSFMQGATDGAAAHGADVASLVLSAPASRPREFAAVVAKIETYGGALFIGDEFEPLIRHLTAMRFPLVTIAGDPRLAVTVNYNQKAGVHLAVEHLLAHGFTRLGFFGQMTGPFAAKFGHFLEALRQAGRSWNAALGHACPTHHEAAAAAEALLAAPARPEALFVDSYYKAEILVRTLAYHGLTVPGDLAVLAYGTEHAGGIRPPLSYVRVPAEEMGREAASTLCRLIAGKVAPRTQRTLLPRLEAGRSCGCREPAVPAGRDQRALLAGSL